MTDQKRDESFDIAVEIECCGDNDGEWSTHDMDWNCGNAEPWDLCDQRKPDSDNWIRFVPHAHLVAAEYRAEDIAKDCHAMAQEIEHERAILSDVKAWASEEINELRATIAEQKARIDAVNALLSEHGCDCECNCAPGEHETKCAEHTDEDECNEDCPVECDVCFACRVQAALCGD